ncbi:hypothetical protein [Methylobacterium sp.]|uniref:hypothetical protein n=1 Tax=Methylobacterium sp. TaxID=409 RepID=UPI002624DCBC|nr:hypothetical protein [Methylobacterium sp.]MDB5648432.1 protein of unassigned function [Methylobacterium sp.]
MSLRAAPETAELVGAARRRAIAISNVNWFRAIAWKALRDGNAQSALRAANARAAARIVLRQARRDALVSQIAIDAMSGTVRPSARARLPACPSRDGTGEPAPDLATDLAPGLAPSNR